MQNFIPDGYDELGFIAEQRGLFGALRFRYRPILAEERAVIGEAYDNAAAGGKDQIIAKALSTRLVSWDVRDPAGVVVPIRTDTVLRLRPKLYDLLWLVVSGARPSDPGPTATDEQKDRVASERLQAALEGRPLSDVRETNDAKN